MSRPVVRLSGPAGRSPSLDERRKVPAAHYELTGVCFDAPPLLDRVTSFKPSPLAKPGYGESLFGLLHDEAFR